MLNPTPYPDVNVLLEQLLAGAQAVLGARFAGLYLYGSLAAGGFTPQRSDIDMLVATTAEIRGETLRALQAMHARLAAADPVWGAELEGAYIPLGALRRYDPANARHPHLERGGDLRVEQHETDWVVQRYVLREHGVTLAGAPIRTLIDPVTPDQLRRAVIDLFHFWWQPMLAGPARLRPPGYQVYAVLTMCRMLYTLQSGTVASKPDAAHWAQAALGAPHAALIARADAWRNGDPFDYLEGTLALIDYTRARMR